MGDDRERSTLSARWLPVQRAGQPRLHHAYWAAQHAAGMGRVQLPHGGTAWLATRYADARLVFSDNRLAVRRYGIAMNPGSDAQGLSAACCR